MSKQLSTFNPAHIEKMVAETDAAIEEAVMRISQKNQVSPGDALFMVALRSFDGMMDFAPQTAAGVLISRGEVNKAKMQGESTEALDRTHSKAVDRFWKETQARMHAARRQN